MRNNMRTEINNSTHNELNIVGNNNKLGDVNFSNSCTLKSKIMQKINMKAEKAHNKAWNAVEATSEYKDYMKANKAHNKAYKAAEDALAARGKTYKAAEDALAARGKTYKAAEDALAARDKAWDVKIRAWNNVLSTPEYKAYKRANKEELI